MGTEPDQQEMRLYARFSFDQGLQPLIERLRKTGLSDEHIDVFSNRPLQLRVATRSSRLVRVPVIAGIIGILIGIGLTAGTALLYPITTGGKPIVAFPIVGLITYETMMLCAIVATVGALALYIFRSGRRHAAVPELERDDVAVVVRVHRTDARVEHIRRLLQDADAMEVQVLEAV